MSVTAGLITFEQRMFGMVQQMGSNLQKTSVWPMFKTVADLSGTSGVGQKPKKPAESTGATWVSHSRSWPFFISTQALRNNIPWDIYPSLPEDGTLEAHPAAEP
jgi:hypothetical protein